VRVERRLVVPELKDDKLVWVESALKDLELLAAGLLLDGAAAVGHGLGQLGALPWLGIRGDDKTDRHRLLLACRA
jgi:hypothetical protein